MAATNQPTASIPSDAALAAELNVDFGGALPKQEIQALQFLEKHPSYDGTGVVIAIFDTGVDPGASGLQRTPDGRHKIIDVVDCTGSGDIDTSTVVEANEDGYITGLLGTPLRINPAWKNPSGKWHVGARPAYDLFPGPLKSRIKEERKKKFDKKQREAVTAATKALAAFESAQSEKTTTITPPTPPTTVAKEKEELEARIKILEELSGAYEDKGPMVEAVVWNDGQTWWAALDTSSFYDANNDTNNNPGRLDAFTPLTNYKDCLQHGTFSPQDACNFAINVYDQGTTLSVVVDAGSHGTHVAGIAAAYHPEDQSLNGIAPGAQIVSCKIGDTRLGSMETMVGLTRALITVLHHGCDLINMSYGEATATPNAGRFVRLAEELVYKHNVVFVASAGNAGPALSTVGAPGGTSSAILGVGAFVTPQLAAAGHSLREVLAAGQQYTWSSRGPTPDGEVGVTFSAPGGAIAPVPQWSGQKMQLMNGTSMASPCACGGLALLLSALKAEGQPITPARIRRAIENTALVLDPGTPSSTLTYGRGLLQVADAHAYLQQGQGSAFDSVLKDLRLEVGVRRSDGATPARGILLRDPSDALGPTTWSVDIKPRLKEDADIKEERLEIDLKLRVRSTVSWVKVPDLLLVHHNGRSFEVEVDPTKIEGGGGGGGGLEYAEIQGFDSAAEWRGPLFRVPITVIKPLLLPSRDGSSTNTYVSLGEESFVPGKEVRAFVGVPLGATWAELKISLLSGDTSKSFMVRATSIVPHTRYGDTEHRAFVQLAPGGGGTGGGTGGTGGGAESVATFGVVAGKTLEVTVAQFWSSLGNCQVHMSLCFHGVVSSGGNSVTVVGGGGAPTKLLVTAPLGREKVKPTAKLESVSYPLRPIKYAIKPLSAPRDVLPENRTIHQMVLTYKLSLTEGGKVTPRVPLLNRYVYDSEVEAQMTFVRDDNNQLYGVGDIYPEAVKLPKGEYTIELQLRHEDPSLLERLKTLGIVAERKLETPVTVPVYGSNGDAVRGKDALVKERPLCGGESMAVFVGPVPEDKLPKDAVAVGGRWMTGKLTLGVTGYNGKEAPGGVQLTYFVAPAPPSTTTSSSTTATTATKTPTKSLDEQMQEAIRDAEVKFLSGIKTDSDENKEKYEQLLTSLSQKYPQHLPLLREPLKRFSTTSDRHTNKETLMRIISCADKVLSAIDTTELAVFVAAKCPEDGEGAAERKKEMDEKKSAVIEALAAKTEALVDVCALEKQSTGEDGSGEGGDESAATSPSSSSSSFVLLLEETWGQLRRWVDPTADPAHALLASKREEQGGRFALALRTLDKSNNSADEGKPVAKEVFEKRAELFKELGWEHWSTWERTRRAFAYPAWK